MDLSNVFSLSGILVFLLLFICLVLATIAIIERTRFWWRVNRQQYRFARQTIELYRNDPSLALAKVQQNLSLPLARIFLAALEIDRPTAEEFRLAMESELQAELPILKRFSSLLEMIVGLAPMLGLIGTVTGLITSFGGLNLGDIGSTKTASVSAGIGEALTTTAAGLVVAMIALIAASLFRGFYQRQLAFIQEYGGQLELLYRRLYESGDRPPASRQTVDASTNHHLTPEPLPPTLPEPAV